MKGIHNVVNSGLKCRFDVLNPVICSYFGPNFQFSYFLCLGGLDIIVRLMVLFGDLWLNTIDYEIVTSIKYRFLRGLFNSIKMFIKTLKSI